MKKQHLLSFSKNTCLSWIEFPVKYYKTNKTGDYCSRCPIESETICGNGYFQVSSSLLACLINFKV